LMKKIDLMEIRPEQAGDAPVIGRLTNAAFENVPYSRKTEAAIVDALRAAGALTISLVAVENGKIVGHVAFSPATVDTVVAVKRYIWIPRSGQACRRARFSQGQGVLAHAALRPSLTYAVRVDRGGG